MSFDSPVLDETIRVSARSTFECLSAWATVVELRPLKQGFEVWQRCVEGSDMLGEDEEEDHEDGSAALERIDTSSEPLTWRSAAEALNNRPVSGVYGGSLMEGIAVESPCPGWANELLAIAFIHESDEYHGVLDRMLELSDEDLVLYYAYLGPFDDPEFGTRLLAADDLACGEGQLAEALRDLKWQGDEPREQVERAIEIRQEIYYLLYSAGAPDASLDAWSRGMALGPQPKLADLERLKERVEDWLDSPMDLPEPVVIEAPPVLAEPLHPVAVKSEAPSTRGAAARDLAGCPRCQPLDPEAVRSVWAGKPLHVAALGRRANLHLTLIACPYCGQHAVEVSQCLESWTTGEASSYWDHIPVTPAEASQLQRLEVGVLIDRIEALSSARRRLSIGRPSSGRNWMRWESGGLRVYPGSG